MQNGADTTLGRGALAQHRLRVVRRWIVGAAVLALALRSAALADEIPVARISVTSATAGSYLGGNLVEGFLQFGGGDYLLTLRGVARSVTTRGDVFGAKRARDIGGTYHLENGALANSNGVVIRFNPPLELAAGRLEIEVSAGIQPKQSRGAPGAGVE